MEPLAWDNKDPAEVLDYAVDLSKVLESGETIVSVTWDVPAGLVKGAEGIVGKAAVVWLSGGTAGTTYPVGCRVVTSLSRTYDREVSLFVTNL